MIKENKWKCLSKGYHVTMVPLVLFSDDVSGNVSKKWNKFDVWAMLLPGLPRTSNSHLENIHFLGASNLVGPMEMVAPIVDDLNQLENGLVMYDSVHDKDVLVVAPVLCVIADNPRASELLNHIGTSARMFCRICMVYMQ